MARQPFRFRLQASFWEHNPPLLRLARRVRRGLSLVLYRLRGATGETLPPLVVTAPSSAPVNPVAYPAISIVPASTTARDAVAQFLEKQTESSVVIEGERPADTDFVFSAEGTLDRLPPTHLESLLLAAATGNLDWTVAGWSPPAPGRFGPSGQVLRDPATDEASHLLLRLPHLSRPRSSEVLGRSVPHICRQSRAEGFALLRQTTTAASGPYRLPPTVTPNSIVRHPVQPVDEVLAAQPPVSGPRTALFLLPYLAVGGAERLLFDLLRGLRDRYRLLVVTTEPHLESLGQTVGRCRGLTSHVYTLGDWLPREALTGALKHLVRRWSVESLICWNGNTLFYDQAVGLRRRFPNLRIINQLFNHEGGWIEHYSPSLADAVDCHLAVNSPIARALTTKRGVSAERVVTIHHGVDVLHTPSQSEKARRRQRSRASLGLPEDATVVGTFVRLHPQKRPLDVVRLAQRMRDENVHFLLIGGGPLDREVDHEIRQDQPPNLTRLPMRTDTIELYDALDICLLTSSFEGLPVFLLDGLARGIPCVAPAVGDIPLLLERGGGIVVENPGDLDALSLAVRTLLDEPLRKEEGDRGRNRVRSRFGLERYVSSYESVIFPKP